MKIIGLVIAFLLFATFPCFAVNIKSLKTDNENLFIIKNKSEEHIFKKQKFPIISTIKDREILEKELQKEIEKEFINKDIDVYIHIYSTEPLDYTIMVTKKGSKIPNKWWKDKNTR